MPQKKSRRVASRQAAASKQRKKKKRAQVSQQRAVTAPTTPTPTDIAAPPEPVTPPVTQPVQQVASGFQYIRTDLRKIGIIAGAIIIILIILGFIL